MLETPATSKDENLTVEGQPASTDPMAAFLYSFAYGVKLCGAAASESQDSKHHQEDTYAVFQSTNDTVGVTYNKRLLDEGVLVAGFPDQEEPEKALLLRSFEEPIFWRVMGTACIMRPQSGQNKRDSLIDQIHGYENDGGERHDTQTGMRVRLKPWDLVDILNLRRPDLLTEHQLDILLEQSLRAEEFGAKPSDSILAEDVVHLYV